MAVKIDPKLLKGLKYHDHIFKEVEKEGRKVREYSPTERPLKPEDVLAVKEYPDKFVIVTADGQKYEIPKKEGDK